MMRRLALMTLAEVEYNEMQIMSQSGQVSWHFNPHSPALQEVHKVTPHRDVNENINFAIELKKLAESAAGMTKYDLWEVVKWIRMVRSHNNNPEADSILECFLHSLGCIWFDRFCNDMQEMEDSTGPKYAGAPYNQEKDEDSIRRALEKLGKRDEYDDKKREDWK